MKNTVRIISLILVLVLALTSCSIFKKEETETSESVPEYRSFDNIGEYTIVRSENADDATKKASVALYTALKEKLGADLNLGDDFVKRGEEIPVGTKEILVGYTNRPESEAQRYSDYTVGYVNDRIVINGGSAEAVAAAVDWFIENCIKDTVSVPSKAYVYTATYAHDGVSINGVMLKNFFVKDTDGNSDDYLRQWLGNQAGCYNVAGENLILVQKNKALLVNEISVSMSDKNVLLEVSPYLENEDAVVERFIKLIENRTADEVSLCGKENVEMNGFQVATSSVISEWRKETDERIAEIQTSPNMTIPGGATVYYVSNNGDDSADGRTPETAWKTVEKVNSVTLATGSYVCFERGGLWRGVRLSARAGVTYTAYGIGEKPVFYGSPENGADPAKWIPTSEDNIWYYSGSERMGDVGAIVFNHGEAVGIKAILLYSDSITYNHTTNKLFDSWKDLDEDLHYYHEPSGKLYIYCEENPAYRFDDIEFNVAGNIISVGNRNGVHIDNLCLKYTGNHGIGAKTCSDLTVTNCEIAWIGGSIQSNMYHELSNGKAEVRLGNGIEIYGGCDGFLVDNNYIYQIYDAGITQQINVGGSATNIQYQKNMTYSNNVLEYCYYSIEYFLSSCPADNPSRMENFIIEGNHMWYQGAGWSQQRPPMDSVYGAHIKGQCSSSGNRATNYIIRNNLMVGITHRFVRISSNLLNPDGTDSMPTFVGNVFAAEYGQKFGQVEQFETPRVSEPKYTGDVKEYLADRSDGTNTYWFIDQK